MNHSFRRWAILGLLGLGASSAGAQTSLLNVNYNAATRTLSFTATTAKPGGELPTNITVPVPSGNGLLLEQFFAQNYSGSGLGGSVPFISTSGSGIKAFSSSENPTWVNPSDAFNSPYDDLNGTRGLMLLSWGGSTLNFSTAQQAFDNTSTLSFTFGENAVPPLRTESYVGMINVLASSGTSYDIGTYSYTYSAVPEPSTYAAIAGALGLGYAVYRRRRQAAAAVTPA
jgi:hypothetical protein